jgi:hypothetical protein
MFGPPIFRAPRQAVWFWWTSIYGGMSDHCFPVSTESVYGGACSRVADSCFQSAADLPALRGRSDGDVIRLWRSSRSSKSAVVR